VHEKQPTAASEEDEAEATYVGVFERTIDMNA
jgi:hypothetical protein